jgi:hypothetical protein
MPPNEEELEKKSPEEIARIFSKNIPPKKMSKSKGIVKKESLMEEMFKMYSGKNVFIDNNKIVSPKTFSNSSYSISMPKNMNPLNIKGYDPYHSGLTNEDKRLVLFYGFNGLLAQKYSLIDTMTSQEIQARMAFAGDKVPWKIEAYSSFQYVVYMFKNTPNALIEIAFDDAMTIIRMGIQVVQSNDFEEPKEDEFDDNCLDTCKPGMHKCGK